MFPCDACGEITENADYIVEKRFYSKKNEVYKARCRYEAKTYSGVVVVKRYLQSSFNRKKEIRLLRYLKEKGLTVPEVYLENHQYIMMEYIDGKTFLDVIEEREENQSIEKGNVYRSNEGLINKLIEWLEKFYFCTDGNYILKDINLRNFIVNRDGIVYGFDFEDCSIGRKEEDAGKLCAYILTYHPPFTPWKLQFTKEVFDLFCKKFQINKAILFQEVEREISNINKKRGENFSIELFKKVIE